MGRRIHEFARQPALDYSHAPQSVPLLVLVIDYRARDRGRIPGPRQQPIPFKDVKRMYNVQCSKIYFLSLLYLQGYTPDFAATSPSYSARPPAHGGK